MINPVKNSNPWRLAKPIEPRARKITTQPYTEGYFMQRNPLAKDAEPVQKSGWLSKCVNYIRDLF